MFVRVRWVEGPWSPFSSFPSSLSSLAWSIIFTNVSQTIFKKNAIKKNICFRIVYRTKYSNCRFLDSAEKKLFPFRSFFPPLFLLPSSMKMGGKSCYGRGGGKVSLLLSPSLSMSLAELYPCTENRSRSSKRLTWKGK